jgi:hypothetical protein
MYVATSVIAKPAYSYSPDITASNTPALARFDRRRSKLLYR